MSDAYYHTRAWRRLAAECIRQQPICATPGCGEPSVAADHVLDRAKGGADALWNLRGQCLPCHNARRGKAAARAKGCAPDGTPLDPGHWWRT